VKRRDLLKAIGIGGLIPFVKTEQVQAASPEVQPQVVQPDTRYPSYPSGTASLPYRYSSLSGINGTAFFSTDDATWQKLCAISSWELTVGDE
jgi:hypothetical protein